MKKGLSWMGVRRLWVNFLNFFYLIGLVFLYCSTNGCFSYMLGLEDLLAISWTKNNHFWANNGQNNKKCCFSLKNGYFWPKKWQTGLITLAYQKSTHLCYNFKKKQPNWVKYKKCCPKSFALPSVKGPFSCIFKF